MCNTHPGKQQVMVKQLGPSPGRLRLGSGLLVLIWSNHNHWDFWGVNQWTAEHLSPCTSVSAFFKKMKINKCLEMIGTWLSHVTCWLFCVETVAKPP